jgi:nucleotide-binding universal stress UspA family protein
MRYLVATDGSTESDDAVRYAARQALALDASLEIVHVLTPETELVDGKVVMSGEPAAIEEGERLLDRAAEQAEDAVTDSDGTLDPATELLTGWPADAVVDYAETTDADAIYVGHRGLSAEREKVVGSVAKTILDKARVPVTVIR